MCGKLTGTLIRLCFLAGLASYIAVQITLALFICSLVG